MRTTNSRCWSAHKLRSLTDKLGIADDKLEMSERLQT
jgi:hypothetical protein